jgi:hypothetical protein
VVGFIIGIEGKNINRIRDMSGAKIDVFQHDINTKYRQIELAGSALDISRATEKIYKIVNKYYFFNQDNMEGRHEYYNDDRRDRVHRTKREEVRSRRRDDEKRGRLRLIKKHKSTFPFFYFIFFRRRF